MAREWLLRGVDPEELKPTAKEETPQTIQSRWDNFWYHHKLKFWLILFAVVVLTILVVQIVTRDTPDYQVLFISEQLYTDKELGELADYLEKYGKDLDGDGKVEVQVENCCFTADPNLNSSIQQIQQHSVAGDRMFFIWDPAGYDYFKKNYIDRYKGGDYLTAITVQDAGLLYENTVWNWSEDDRHSEELKKRWPTLYFGVRMAGTTDASKQLHKESITLLEALVADEKQGQ